MKFIGTKEITETVFVSDNSIWTMRETIIYRTLFGFRVWEISRKRTAYKYGEPYIAKI